MSTSSGSNPSSPRPGTSGGFPHQQPQVVPIVQIDHNKTPCFYGDLKLDSITALEWAARIDQMKVTHDWTEAQAFANAKNALFGIPARWAVNLKQTRDGYVETWEYLRKEFLAQYGPAKNARSYIDALFQLKPRHNTMSDLQDFYADIFDAFRVLEDTLPAPERLPAGNQYTADQAYVFVKAAHTAVIEHLKVAFLMNLMPPELRMMIQDKEPATVKDVTKLADNAQLAVKNKNKPIGSSINEVYAEPKPVVNAVLNEDPEISAMRVWYRQNRGRGSQPSRGNNSNRGNQNRSNSGQQQNSGSQQGKTNANKGKHCTYCLKKNHHQEICYKRKNDNAPCYDSKGNQYWPKVNSSGQENDGGQANLGGVTMIFPNQDQSVFL